MKFKSIFIFIAFCTITFLPYKSISSSSIIKTTNILNTDSISKKKDFKKVEKFLMGVFKKKKVVKATPRKVKFVHKDTAVTSAYINDLKKYGKILLEGSGKLEKKWDSIHNIKHVTYKASSSSVNKIIYGFHPYWMGSAYKSYNFNLLTHLALFTYELNPKNGELKSSVDWSESSILDSAAKHSCKVNITITNFTQHNNRQFLSSESAQDKSIESILNILNVSLKQVAGVVLDFENVPADSRADLTNYVNRLSDSLKTHGKTVHMTIPAIDPSNSYDISSLKPHLEYFLLMGYDYFGSWSNDAGPVAPMYSQPIWGSYSVEASVHNYIAKGLPQDQLVLVVPYYGSFWEVDNTEVPTKKVKFLSSLLYKEVRSDYSADSILLEPVSKSAYILLELEDKYHQVWYDDIESLTYKYDLINTEKLAGVGIWALGYDNGYTDLWQLLEYSFGSDESVKSPIKRSINSNFEFNIEDWYETIEGIFLVKVILLIISAILFLGFVLSLRQHEIREVIFRRSLISLLFLMLAPCICLYIILATPYTFSGFLLLMGLLFGYGIYFIKEQTQFKSKKRLP